jgi:hypothetical protein
MEKDVLGRLREALGGTVTVEPGYDLTQPACSEWADIVDDPNWNAWADELPKPVCIPRPESFGKRP